MPYNHDRSKSFEVCSLQILTSAWETMRFPLACVPKHWMVKNTTWDAIWHVLKWSLQAAASGVWPANRHDHSAFGKVEFHRKKKAGKPLTRAILLQVKGDWSFYKNETGSCCWKCNMVPGNLKEVGTSASWRMLANRKNHWQTLQQLKSVSPLSGVPFFHTIIPTSVASILSPIYPKRPGCFHCSAPKVTFTSTIDCLKFPTSKTATNCMNLHA